MLSHRGDQELLVKIGFGGWSYGVMGYGIQSSWLTSLYSKSSANGTKEGKADSQPKFVCGYICSKVNLHPSPYQLVYPPTEGRPIAILIYPRLPYQAIHAHHIIHILSPSIYPHLKAQQPPENKSILKHSPHTNARILHRLPNCRNRQTQPSYIFSEARACPKISLPPSMVVQHSSPTSRDCLCLLGRS